MWLTSGICRGSINKNLALAEPLDCAKEALKDLNLLMLDVPFTSVMKEQVMMTRCSSVIPQGFTHHKRVR